MTYLETELGPQNLTMGGSPLDPHLLNVVRMSIFYYIFPYIYFPEIFTALGEMV